MSRVTRGFKTKLPHKQDEGEVPSTRRNTACSWCVGAASPLVIRRVVGVVPSVSVSRACSRKVWTSSCNAKPQERSAVADINVAPGLLCSLIVTSIVVFLQAGSSHALCGQLRRLGGHWLFPALWIRVRSRSSYGYEHESTAPGRASALRDCNRGPGSE